MMLEVDMAKGDALQIKSCDTKVSLEININDNGFFQVTPFEVTRSE